MTPMTLDSVTEQDCLSKLTVSTNWTGNSNYWTGGTAAGPSDIVDALKWESGQPDNLVGRQDCIHLKNIKGAGLRLTDRNCTDRYILACKVFDYLKKRFTCGKNIEFSTGKSQGKAAEGAT
jgi:hypothetical protein